VFWWGVSGNQCYGDFAPAEARGAEERIIFKIRPERVLILPPQG
jgi:hypothetical protein